MITSTGTNVIGLLGTAKTRRRSGQPSLARFNHLKIRLALRPCRRATSATDACGARASATIRCLCSRLHDRRPSASTLKTSPPPSNSTPAGVRIAIGVHSISGGHLSKLPQVAVGGRHQTLTLAPTGPSLRIEASRWGKAICIARKSAILHLLPTRLPARRVRFKTARPTRRIRSYGRSSMEFWAGSM